MGAHLLRLALLLAALQYAAMLVAPTKVPLLIDELLTNGGRRYIKAQWNGKYLTGEEHHTFDRVDLRSVQPGGANHFTFVQISDSEVALRASSGKFLGDYSPIDLSKNIGDKETWTPLKNKDGSWSFKSDAGEYLSGKRADGKLTTVDINDKTEKFRVDETWEIGGLVAELLANGGRYTLKAPCNEQGYLTGPKQYNEPLWVTIVAGTPADIRHHWTLVQVSDTEVALRASNGRFLCHDPRTFSKTDWLDVSKKAEEKEKWTPEKYRPGLWGFKSRNDGDAWLSSKNQDGWAVGASDHARCETWTLEPWHPKSRQDALIAELLASGGRYVLESCEGSYLTGDGDKVDAKGGPTGNTKHWTMVQVSDTEVALRASNGKFLGDHTPIDLRGSAEKWEFWTPEKNMDGSWSFKSQEEGENRWLSARDGKVEIQDNKHKCVKWRLHEW